MAVERLGGGDAQMACVIAKCLLEGVGLNHIAHLRGRAMCVHIVNVAGRQSCTGERELHGAHLPVGVWFGDIECVGAVSIAHKLGVNAGTTPFGALTALQNQRRRAFAEHEAGAIGREGLQMREGSTGSAWARACMASHAMRFPWVMSASEPPATMTLA